MPTETGQEMRAPATMTPTVFRTTETPAAWREIDTAREAP
jgi:hypothetical protein